jgi:light-regulated signal transduction histidine kinase (bacteriophytochrome)
MVVAELVDPNTTIDLYKGLHFPASDIPAPLVKINCRVWINQFGNNHAVPAAIELINQYSVKASQLLHPTIDLYKGLHFPASDIPAQARELYKINKVRLLYDSATTMPFQLLSN